MWLSEREIQDLGLRAFGHGIQVDPSVRFYGAQHIAVGAHTRIDANCVIVATDKGITIGRHAHIAAGVVIAGGGGFAMDDFAGLSANVTVITQSDDFVGGFMTNPTVPMSFRRISSSEVALEKHALVGAASTILPGVKLEFGSAVGANSLVRHSVGAGKIVAGYPAKQIGARSTERLQGLQEEFETSCPCFVL